MPRGIGVTILAASRPTRTSTEFVEHGVFTSLVLNALDGRAADFLGNVSAASTNDENLTTSSTIEGEDVVTKEGVA